MSDRRAVAPDEKLQAWMRRVDAQLAMLTRRKVQGALTMESVETTSDVSVGGVLSALATALQPVEFRDSGTGRWRWDLEKLGTGTANSLVARDENGAIRDIIPKPAVVVTGGANVSVATGVFTLVPLTGATPLAQGYAGGDLWDAVNSCVLMPIAGLWEFGIYGGWVGVADNTERAILTQISNQGGAFANFVGDTRTGAATAAEGVNMSLMVKAVFAAGARLRYLALHRSATTPLNWVPNRFSLTWIGPGS